MSFRQQFWGKKAWHRVAAPGAELQPVQFIFDRLCILFPAVPENPVPATARFSDFALHLRCQLSFLSVAHDPAFDQVGTNI
jgi:hypothetical protein